MKRMNEMTRSEAWVLVITGLIMGTVFTFGMQYWNAPVAREEAVSTTAIYASYKTQMSDGRVKEIILRFEDHEQLYIDGVCITDELQRSIHGLTPGTRLSMMVHPNSNTVMDMKAGDTVLLEFENTSEKLTGEAMGFMGLGLFCYVLFACGLIRLLPGKKTVGI